MSKMFWGFFVVFLDRAPKLRLSSKSVPDYQEKLNVQDEMF